MNRVSKILNHSSTNTLHASNTCKSEESERFVVRRLQLGDFHKGFSTLLGQLTTVGDLNFSSFKSRFELQNSWPTSFQPYNVAVIEDLKTETIVATATLLIEYKFIHSCGSVGHVEDVVVNDSYRGKKLGKRVVSQLLSWASSAGCYKVILDCSENNVPFYQALGFTQKEVQMSCYLN